LNPLLHFSVIKHLIKKTRKLSKTDFSLPKDKVQEIARLLETDANRILNQLKSLLLWDNIVNSGIVIFFLLFNILDM
jgi:hypothetical protein